MKKYIFNIIVIFLVCSCSEQKRNDTELQTYFKPGDLSKDAYLDSIRNAYYSKTLFKMHENSLRNLSKDTYSFRLTVFPTIYNPYCIYVERIDSVSRVTLKIAGDEKNFVRAGLKNMVFTYDSNHKRMDSLWIDLSKTIEQFDFYPGFDDVDFVAADGTDYLLEEFNKGKYRVVVGWGAGEYKGKEELFNIITKIHILVPNDLLPNLHNPKTLEDVLFPVFKRDSAHIKQRRVF